jgi:hypothetical protein
MQTQDGTGTGNAGSNRVTKTIVTLLAVAALVVVLTWAISVIFEVALVKALAGVVLILFAVVVAMFMLGIT